MPEPRTLLFDLETAPSLGYFYDRYKEGNILEVVQEGFILSFAYKWLDEKAVRVRALPDFPSYQKNKQCDRALMGELWELMDAADIIVAHNADRFDIRWAHARFLANGLTPYNPAKSVDTLKIARRHFKFGSNKLDDLGHYLGVGRKLFTLGRDILLGAVAGNRRCWADLKKYNAQDVLLLERVYLKLRPWATNHPNLSYISRRVACPVCQSKRAVHKGWLYYKLGKRQRQKCLDCGHRYVTGAIIRDDAPLRSNRGR